MKEVDLSVIICTLNRCALLKKCLQSLGDQKCAPWVFEIIVVDNGSTDGTRSTVEDFLNRGLNVKYIFDSQKCIGHTRNVGLSSSQGRYVAYLDDDVIACATWCAAVCGALERAELSTNSRVGVVGGPIDPIFEVPKPSWLTQDIETVYAVVDLGKEARYYPARSFPLSANMACLRRVLPERSWNEKLVMCEDVELGARMRRTGVRFLYVPEMRVQHFISARRLNRDWLLDRYFAEGLAHKHIPLGALHMIRVTLAAFVKIPFLFLCAFGPEHQRLKFQCSLRFYQGHLMALAGLKSSNTAGYVSARRKASF